MNTIENKSEEPITEYDNERYRKNKLKDERKKKIWKNKEEKKITKQQLESKQIRAQLNRTARRIARRDAKAAKDIQREERRRNRKSIVQEVEEFAVMEHASALNNWARQFKIQGRPGIDIPNYLRAIRVKITELLANNRNTKVKIYLEVLLERTSNLQRGSTETTTIAL